MYHEMIDDKKIGTLSDAEFRTWVELLCVACESNEKGDTMMTEKDLSWRLRRDVTETLQKLAGNGLVTFQDHGNGGDTVKIKQWMKRQFISDSSTGRVRKHRKKLNKTA